MARHGSVPSADTLNKRAQVDRRSAAPHLASREIDLGVAEAEDVGRVRRRSLSQL